MATSYTSILKLALPATGELAGTWGDVVNQNITSMIEEAIAGLATINTWAGASHTLTVSNGTTSESRAAILELSGSPGAAATVICPDETKIYVVRNGVSGGFAATIKTAAGTGVTIPNGKVAAVYCDGTNVRAATEFFSSVDIDGGTIDGTTIGATSASTGAFTTLASSSTTVLNGTTIPASKTLVDTDSAQTLTNKTISADDNTLSGIAASSFVLSNASGNIDGAAAQKAIPSGVVVGTTDTQTLTNKTLTSPTITGDLSIADKIVHTGDTNTAIRFPAADTVTIETSGSEALRVDSSGNVGIGTSSPTALLNVSGSATTAKTIIQNTGTGATTFNGSGAGLELLAGSMNTSSKYTPAIKFGSTDPDFTTTNPKFGAAITAEAMQTYSSDTTGGMDLAFWTAPISPGTGSGLAERMRIDSSGNVGIGTTSPYRPATLRGTGEQLMFDLNSSTTNDFASIVWNGSTADLSSGNASAEIRGFREGSGAFGALTFHTRGSGATSDERMRITSAGNVGIGTNAPSNIVRVDVLGIDGNIRTANVGTDSTAKFGRLIGRHYDNTESNTYVAGYSNTATENLVFVGGGSGVLNQATNVRFFTATNNNTLGSTERMRIDSSGNVLIGQSSTTTPGLSNTTAGLSLRGSGEVFASVNNSAAGYFNRNTDDGTLVTFRRQGINVGSVSVTTTATTYNTSGASGITGVDANTVAIRTNSAERMRIESAGKILYGAGVYAYRKEAKNLSVGAGATVTAFDLWDGNPGRGQWLVSLARTAGSSGTRSLVMAGSGSSTSTSIQSVLVADANVTIGVSSSSITITNETAGTIAYHIVATPLVIEGN
jgi:hypothetical protein